MVCVCVCVACTAKRANAAKEVYVSDKGTVHVLFSVRLELRVSLLQFVAAVLEGHHNSEVSKTCM